MLQLHQFSCFLPHISLIFISTISTAATGEGDITADPGVKQESQDTAGVLQQPSNEECPYLEHRLQPNPVAEENQAGYVLIFFDVSETGEPIDVQELEWSVGDNQLAEALELVSAFRYRPAKREGDLVVYKSWIERIDFLTEGSMPEPHWPQPDVLLEYLDYRCSSHASK